MSESIYSSEFKIRVALGLVPGWRIFRKFGMHDSVAGTNTQEDVWPLGGKRVLPTSGGALSVVSSSTADDADPAGTGAWNLVVEGLDSSYNEISETIVMNGTTAVASAGSDWFRINRAYVGSLVGAASAGTAEGNVGNITVSIGGNAQAYVEAGEGQTHQVMYTVPAGHYVVIDQYRWAVGRMAGSTDVQVIGAIKLATQNAWRFISDIYAYGPETYSNDGGATLIPPKTEIKMMTDSSGATEISGIVAGYLVKLSETQR